MTARRRATAVAIVAMLLAPRPAAGTTDARVDEHQVKAAFLFNFAKFVAWPEPPPGPFVIGIAGDEGLGDAIETAVRGKTVGGRPLEVRRLSASDDPHACQILFVGASEKRRAADLVRRAGKGVLTVGDTPQFVRDGGVIGFIVDQNRVRFRINGAAAEEAGLKIHSQLMSLAAN